jgi:hypothetical protein
MKSTFNQHIGIFENAISKDFCDYAIERFNTYLNNPNKEPIERTFTLSQDFTQDISLSSNEFMNEDDKDYMSKNLNFLVKEYIKKYRSVSPMIEYGFEIHDYKMQKTKPQEGYHVWHSEYAVGGEFNRRWGVYTIYLNDIKEGGETEFLYQSCRVKPKAGTVCIFPAYYTHFHRGNPPLKDEKYIITGWFAYPEKAKKLMIEDYDKYHSQK